MPNKARRLLLAKVMSSKKIQNIIALNAMLKSISKPIGLDPSRQFCVHLIQHALHVINQ